MNNINWAQGVAFVASLLVLATGGKVNLDIATQASLVAAIQGVATIVTLYMHNVTNAKAHQAAIVAAVAKAKG